MHALLSKALMFSLLWFLCDSTPHKLFGRRLWNSTQRQVTLLTISSWNKILEKIIREWFWQQKRSFHVFARNYTSNKRIILKFCARRHYRSLNNIQRQKNIYLLRKWLFYGKISHYTAKIALLICEAKLCCTFSALNLQKK